MKVAGDLNISGATPEVLRAFTGAEVTGNFNVSAADGEETTRPRPSGATAPPLNAGPARHTAVMPDPFTAHTEEEFMAVLRDLWRYTDRPSSRDLAKWSEDPHTKAPAFSHTLAAGLVSENPSKWPTVRLRYIQGFVRACGGDTALIARWTAAWRHVFEGFPLPAPTESALPPGVTPINRNSIH
ncbi:hypothetical protein [Actinocorallia populi]|uniref:hypothetical protein n=1 Tax=Actinocorallia populi TaxID=2079200 RepID=UPI0013004C65|nr:hypothetical protein [Actinocorallia populi]